MPAEETMLRIIKAQKENIARITPGLELIGTTGDGERITIWGPRPNIIRLYDSPLRFINDESLENWERIVTISPLFATPEARITSRSDRSFRYSIHFLVRLTQAEIEQDAEQITSGSLRDEVLAVKAHRLVQDFHHIFFDDHLLMTDDCPQGLVDDQDYQISWDPGVEYPYALFTAEVFGSRSAW